MSLIPPEAVADQEMLARYVLSESSLYRDNRQGSLLRPNLFMPYRGETSVFRVDGLSETERVAAGEKVANERERKHRQAELTKGRAYPEAKCTFRYRGRGELRAHDVRTSGLDVTPKEPPERHANIVGWPQSGNKNADEAAHMLFAMKLQKKASYVSR